MPWPCSRPSWPSLSYACAPIALGMNTDAWQPVERKVGITRGILELLA